MRLSAKSVAPECAAARDGFRVNSVHPGTIETPIWDKLPAGLPGGWPQRPAGRPRHRRARGAAGRTGPGSEVADGVLFPASDASRRVTGSGLVMDGGMTAGGVGNLAAAR